MAGSCAHVRVFSKKLLRAGGVGFGMKWGSFRDVLERLRGADREWSKRRGLESAG